MSILVYLFFMIHVSHNLWVGLHYWKTFSLLSGDTYVTDTELALQTVRIQCTSKSQLSCLWVFIAMFDG